ncbi:MAG: MBL fold metallo-hydrolase [Ruminococcaceae bacterium]|nr:MBL fold metallo-hydrolase [Oscillospiraceae bacterium]
MKIAVLSLGAYQTNCYIVFDEQTRDGVVIDPGYQDARVSAFLTGEGLKLHAILLTHGHFDHVGGVDALRGDTVPVYLCKADLALPGSMTTLDPNGDYCFYSEGDVLQFGTLAFTVLHTPGHTPGSSCLQCEDVLFTGDTLFAGSCGRTDFPLSDPDAMIASLRRLYALEGDFAVLPGHGQTSTLSRERATNLYMKEAMSG